MKLSKRVRDEISKAGIVRWDELADEIASLENDTAKLLEDENVMYIGSLNNILEMSRRDSLDMETTRFILQLYNDFFMEGTKDNGQSV